MINSNAMDNEATLQFITANGSVIAVLPLRDVRVVPQQGEFVNLPDGLGDAYGLYEVETVTHQYPNAREVVFASVLVTLKRKRAKNEPRKLAVLEYEKKEANAPRRPR